MFNGCNCGLNGLRPSSCNLNPLGFPFRVITIVSPGEIVTKRYFSFLPTERELQGRLTANALFLAKAIYHQPGAVADRSQHTHFTLIPIYQQHKAVATCFLHPPKPHRHFSSPGAWFPGGVYQFTISYCSEVSGDL